MGLNAAELCRLRRPSGSSQSFGPEGRRRRRVEGQVGKDGVGSGEARNVELLRHHAESTKKRMPRLPARIMESHRLSGNNGVAPTGLFLKIMGGLMWL